MVSAVVVGFSVVVVGPLVVVVVVVVTVVASGVVVGASVVDGWTDGFTVWGLTKGHNSDKQRHVIVSTSFKSF